MKKLKFELIKTIITSIIVLSTLVLSIYSFYCSQQAIQVHELPDVTYDRFEPEEINYLDLDVACVIPYVEENYSQEVQVLAQIIYGEARGIYSQTEQACIVWTILNRVDCDSINFGDTIKEVALASNQFCYGSYPTTDDYGRDIKALVTDVLARWVLEKQGVQDVGRVLGQEYLFYFGDGAHNIFRKNFEMNSGYWTYLLDSPYET